MFAAFSRSVRVRSSFSTAQRPPMTPSLRTHTNTSFGKPFHSEPRLTRPLSGVKRGLLIHETLTNKPYLLPPSFQTNELLRSHSVFNNSHRYPFNTAHGGARGSSLHSGALSAFALSPLLLLSLLNNDDPDGAAAEGDRYSVPSPLSALLRLPYKLKCFNPLSYLKVYALEPAIVRAPMVLGESIIVFSLCYVLLLFAYREPSVFDAQPGVTIGGIHGGVPDTAPEHDPNATNADAAAKESNAIWEMMAPHVRQLGFSGAVGFLAGYTTKRIGRTVALFAGIILITVQALAFAGVLEVKWSRIEQRLQSVNYKGLWGRFMSVLTYGLTTTAGFGTGFVLGLKS